MMSLDDLSFWKNWFKNYCNLCRSSRYYILPAPLHPILQMTSETGTVYRTYKDGSYTEIIKICLMVIT